MGFFLLLLLSFRFFISFLAEFFWGQEREVKEGLEKPFQNRFSKISKTRFCLKTFYKVCKYCSFSFNLK
jgi:hypothetical protein